MSFKSCFLAGRLREHLLRGHVDVEQNIAALADEIHQNHDEEEFQDADDQHRSLTAERREESEMDVKEGRR